MVGAEAASQRSVWEERLQAATDAVAAVYERQEELFERGEDLWVPADGRSFREGVVSGKMVNALEEALRAAVMAGVDEGVVADCRGWLEWAHVAVAAGRVQHAGRSSRGKSRRHLQAELEASMPLWGFTRDPYGSSSDDDLDPPSCLLDMGMPVGPSWD